MIRIIVAGCGHGGIVAASKLAKNGCDVTVYEKNSRDNMGFDWHDSLRKDTFTKSDIPMPDDSCFMKFTKTGYYNPGKSVKIVKEKDPSPNIVYIDRKFLINYLINFAESQGVKIIFDADISGALYDDKKITGIQYNKNGKSEKVYADMVIDSCGLFSPIRTNLPDKFRIENNINSKDIFCAWRGYFSKTENIIIII